MAKDVFDIVIIGAGPAGLFAQFYAGLRELKTALIESTARVGGQITALYPEKTILDLAAFIGIPGRDLVAKLDQQAQLVNGNTFLNSEVTDIKKTASEFSVEINHHAAIQAKSVIIATGHGSFSPRKIDVPGASEAQQAGLLAYTLPDLSQTKNQQFAVVGGGNTAIDYALELVNHGKQVHLIHRRDNFRALESSMTKLENSDLTTFVTPKKISGLTKQAGKLLIQLQDMHDDSVNTLLVDQLIAGYGFTASFETIDHWQDKPQQYQQGFLTDTAQMTTTPGLFAVGDAASHLGKSDLIISAFGEVPIAVNQAVRYFDPDRGGPQHSTAINTKEIFKHG
ncbi:NAD(P)/FAD-dependent oxidoreductase [Oenococcus sicerae]|uniref:Ferredoxin--NADP reductase n=1 Tax=Oenococcus sicerae TaxID=2203724 RepID=A0AAJ1R8J6_9LACO|nr:NAD(P)/FAD-dependent oxidoreductase [Oenococcus sicerae]MDN6900134.1 NAD(P)/FAD-dependent oxidoreductase [Oenococcus sicerae]QAS69740.1 NAD(P)/FAD-dependent oxidoreductase [Oenococcus sicerae]